MPISEKPAAGTYEEGLDAFLRSHGSAGGAADVAALFHAVRNLAYFSGPDRTPQAALASGRGACTAKHMLLRDLLRRCGEKADVEIVEGDFAAGIPEVASMSEALRRDVREAGVTDFHCYVVWYGPDGEHLLDATWPDSVAAMGFPVNAGWRGKGDTRPALDPVAVKGREEDVIARKEALLATLPEAEAQKRRAFLSRLSAWLADVA